MDTIIEILQQIVVISADGKLPIVGLTEKPVWEWGLYYFLDEEGKSIDYREIFS